MFVIYNCIVKIQISIQSLLRLPAIYNNSIYELNSSLSNVQILELQTFQILKLLFLYYTAERL